MRRTRWLAAALVALVLFAPRKGHARTYVPPGKPAPPMTFAELRSLASLVGFPPEVLDTMAAIALAESAGVANVIGDDGESYGLWQIHHPDWPEFAVSRLLDPQYNAQAALVVLKKQGLKAWSTYNDGSYKEHMP